MDTTTIIILTAVINAMVTGAIGGVILYRVQKNIDASYFQQQTKFVRSHEKMVETLETTFQKFSDFRLEINRHLMDKLSSLASGRELNLDDELSSSFDKADKLFNYFVINSIYVSQNVSTEIMGILSKTKLLYSVISIGFMLINSNKNTMIEFDNSALPKPQILVGTVKDTLITILDVWEIRINGVEKDDFDFDSLFNGVIELLKSYSDVIEKHYRAVSSVK